MKSRIAFIALALALGAFAFWHPARPPAVQSAVTGPTAEPTLGEPRRPSRRHRPRLDEGGDDLVVYVAGAVKSPGLYYLRPGERDAQAVARAGGMGASADASGVNLAQRASDGDEIYVPSIGETPRRHSSQRRSHRKAPRAPPNESVDVNRAGTAELAAVPGIGRSIARRIVELRDREGSFSSLDELLDVAGMTQTRLDRARPYLRDP
jgi:comEA protein